MKSKTYFNATAVIFAATAFMHILRVVNEWSVQLGDWSAPLWISWAAMFVAGYLSYWGFKLGQ